MRKAIHVMMFVPGLFALALAGCTYNIIPRTYSAEPIEAWVRDADSGQPVVGAVVAAQWVLIGGLHTDQVGELVVMEASTDLNGRFYFPGWGPTTATKGSLSYQSPEILIFKSGYKYRRLTNKFSTEMLPSGKVSSEWNKKILKIDRFKGNLEDYENQLRGLYLRIGWAYYNASCEWRKIPNLLAELQRQRKVFLENNVRTRIISASFLVPEKGKEDHCGAKDYFHEDMK